MCSAMQCGIYSALIAILNNLQYTQTAWLRCYKGTIEDYQVAPLDEPLPPAFLSCVNPSLPTIVYTFGYQGRATGPATTAVMTAYIATQKRNIILLDWEEEAKSSLLGVSLGYALYAVPNAKKIGNQMGEALVRLAEARVNMTDIHLIGHSLGAHIMAYAGKRARERGHVVSRITGLDPARTLFEGTFALQSGLDRTCAKFVDIIHTDPSNYGTSTSTGTVDIWPNYVGKGGTQPGCEEGNFDKFTPEDLCSHDRSWRYYVEAISNPTAFPAAAASDYDSWVASHGQTSQTIYLGDLTNPRAQGNFYLATSSMAPFGKGMEGLHPANT